MRALARIACLSAWVLAIAYVGPRQGMAETLGDVLREGGWERMLGTWVDEETGGRRLKLVYSWRFRDTLVELRAWDNGRESVSFMGRHGQTGDIYHFGADREGGSFRGAWTEEEGDAVLQLGYVAPDGEEDNLEVRFRFEGDETVTVTMNEEGEEAAPETIKLVRATKAADRRRDWERERRVAEQHKREGVFTQDGLVVYVDTPARLFDADENMTIQEEELQKGYVGMLEQYADVEGRLLKEFDKDGDGAISEEEGAAIRHLAFGLVRLLGDDRNGDWQVDEMEADQAWERLAEETERRNEGILKRFDRDQDGALNDEETAAARRAVNQRWGRGGR